MAQYFAGSYADIAYAIGHDSNGLVYVGGNTSSPDLALVGSSYQTTIGGVQNLFFAVINPGLPASSQIIYVTYIGGDETDSLYGMTVGPKGDVYMTGTTTSATFPMANAAQTSLGRNHGRGRLCPVAEPEADVELFDLFRRKRHGQWPGDRGCERTGTSG